MSYRLKPRQPASQEVQRVALQRLAKTREALSLPESRHAEAVHQARKRFKELRALLRLVRDPLGKRFAPQNRRLRDAGRALADLRDVIALVEGWDALAASDPERFGTPGLKAVRDRLAARQPADDEAGGSGEAIERVLAEVAEAGREVAAWALRRDGFGLYAAGVERSYRQGRKALAVVRRDPSDEHLHEWRKRVKDQWYQTRLLQAAWPRLFKARIGMLEQLSDWLGDDHDLAMLQALMRDEPELFGDEDTRGGLAPLIAERRQHLQGRALRLGRRLYAESPGALRERWQRYWKLARTA
ncbi:CHAD domain-containing protein [Stutzerimonas azotifigens]|uniref:CHAD domain-containing protein n=1 Tax=Stutzerimonas azotifigens TaxID=291995 RepID=UPI0003F68144|nr:CHAD domain-containing protein [Stutzerimonas azotifigens]